MGLYDRIEIPAEVSLPGVDADPSTIEWQTKTVDRPLLRRFRLTRDGRLLQEETQSETFREEERPFYRTEELDKQSFVGSTRTVHNSWTERQYHGIVEFHASIEQRVVRFEAKFIDGGLTAIRDVGGETPGDWIPAEEVLPETADRLATQEAERLTQLLDTLDTELDAKTAEEDVGGIQAAGETIQAYLDRREQTEQ